jgi:hypothetical protein
MKTTKENLLLIEDSKLDEKNSNTNTTYVIIYDDNSHRKIIYSFHKNAKYETYAFIDDNEDSLIDIHFFNEIEDVLHQLFYITGKKIKIKNG